MSPRPDRASGTRRRRLADKSGFTLIEVLVAFVVMATLLSVLFRGVVGLRAGSVAFDDHTHQELVARAVLDDALAKRDLEPGTYSGQREGRRWTIVAKTIDLTKQMPPPAEKAGSKPGEAATAQPGQAAPQAGAPAPADGASTEKPAWTTQRLTVRVGNGGKPVEIETIRLVKAKAEPGR